MAFPRIVFVPLPRWQSGRISVSTASKLEGIR